MLLPSDFRCFLFLSISITGSPYCSLHDSVSCNRVPVLFATCSFLSAEIACSISIYRLSSLLETPPSLIPLLFSSMSPLPCVIYAFVYFNLLFHFSFLSPWSHINIQTDFCPMAACMFLRENHQKWLPNTCYAHSKTIFKTTLWLNQTLDRLSHCLQLKRVHQPQNEIMNRSIKMKDNEAITESD